jgi:hypothetical protein
VSYIHTYIQHTYNIILVHTYIQHTYIVGIPTRDNRSIDSSAIIIIYSRSDPRYLARSRHPSYGQLVQPHFIYVRWILAVERGVMLLQ